MALLNYTTGIDAWRTIGEVQQLLAAKGATHFGMKTDGGQPVAATFTLDFKGQPLNFSLPVQVDKIKRIVTTNKATRERLVKAGRMKNIDDHALNVGWRIIKDWIEAQLALVEVEMATMEQIFLPYLIVNDQGETLANKMLDQDGVKKLTF